MFRLSSEAEMRARFRELTAAKEALTARAAPFRAEYDKHAKAIDALRAKQRELAAKFKPIEQKTIPIDRERAMIARGLNGKTGEPKPEG